MFTLLSIVVEMGLFLFGVLVKMKALSVDAEGSFSFKNS